MNPHEMSNEQLGQELFERGQVTTGSREDMISTLQVASNGKNWLKYSETCQNQTSLRTALVFRIDRCSVYTG